jgi:hypothetical protein
MSEEMLLHDLIQGHFDGTLSPAEAAQLDLRLKHDRQAVDLFVEFSIRERAIERFFANEQIEKEAQGLLATIGLNLNVIPATNSNATALITEESTSTLIPSDLSPTSGFDTTSPTNSLTSNSTSFLSSLNGFGAMGLFAIAILAAITAGIFYFRDGSEAIAVAEKSPHIAEITSSIDTLWAGSSVPDSDGWLPSGVVELRRGLAELKFNSGVVLVLKAPAKFQVLSPTDALLLQGSLTARVDGTKTNFRVTTPTAKVVDLGTEFGLSVTGSGETDLAVFNGAVDISSDPKSELNSSATKSAAQATTATNPRRLTAGEALSVDWDGNFERISTVRDDRFPALKISNESHVKTDAPLISDVSDNLRPEDAPKFYRVVSHGFGEDAMAYVDRNYEWNSINKKGIPKFLQGADYVMPFNDDKTKNLKVTLTISRPAFVYVLFDDRGTPPDWLKTDFVDTGSDIGLDEGNGPAPMQSREKTLGKGGANSVDYTFSIWKREVTEPGSIVLGNRGGVRSGRAMYGIVVVPKDEHMNEDLAQLFRF